MQQANKGKRKISILTLDKKIGPLHTDTKIRKERRDNMNVLWIVNTNTFLLILLIVMVSYLTTQMTGLIRWLKRE